MIRFFSTEAGAEWNYWNKNDRNKIYSNLPNFLCHFSFAFWHPFASNFYCSQVSKSEMGWGIILTIFNNMTDGELWNPFWPFFTLINCQFLSNKILLFADKNVPQESNFPKIKVFSSSLHIVLLLNHFFPACMIWNPSLGALFWDPKSEMDFEICQLFLFFTIANPDVDTNSVRFCKTRSFGCFWRGALPVWVPGLTPARAHSPTAIFQPVQFCLTSDLESDLASDSSWHFPFAPVWNQWGAEWKWKRWLPCGR